MKSESGIVQLLGYCKQSQDDFFDTLAKQTSPSGVEQIFTKKIDAIDTATLEKDIPEFNILFKKIEALFDNVYVSLYQKRSNDPDRRNKERELILAFITEYTSLTLPNQDVFIESILFACIEKIKNININALNQKEIHQVDNLSDDKKKSDDKIIENQLIQRANLFSCITETHSQLRNLFHFSCQAPTTKSTSRNFNKNIISSQYKPLAESLSILIGQQENSKDKFKVHDCLEKFSASSKENSLEIARKFTQSLVELIATKMGKTNFGSGILDTEIFFNKAFNTEIWKKHSPTILRAQQSLIQQMDNAIFEENGMLPECLLNALGKESVEKIFSKYGDKTIQNIIRLAFWRRSLEIVYLEKYTGLQSHYEKLRQSLSRSPNPTKLEQLNTEEEKALKKINKIRDLFLEQIKFSYPEAQKLDSLAKDITLYFKSATDDSIIKELDTLLSNIKNHLDNAADGVFSISEDLVTYYGNIFSCLKETNQAINKCRKEILEIVVEIEQYIDSDNDESHQKQLSSNEKQKIRGGIEKILYKIKTPTIFSKKSDCKLLYFNWLREEIKEYRDSLPFSLIKTLKDQLVLMRKTLEECLKKCHGKHHNPLLEKIKSTQSLIDSYIQQKKYLDSKDDTLTDIRFQYDEIIHTTNLNYLFSSIRNNLTTQANVPKAEKEFFEFRKSIENNDGIKKRLSIEIKNADLLLSVYRCMGKYQTLQLSENLKCFSKDYTKPIDYRSEIKALHSLIDTISENYHSVESTQQWTDQYNSLNGKIENLPNKKSEDRESFRKLYHKIKTLFIKFKGTNNDLYTNFTVAESLYYNDSAYYGPDALKTFLTEISTSLAASKESDELTSEITTLLTNIEKGSAFEKLCDKISETFIKYPDLQALWNGEHGLQHVHKNAWESPETLEQFCIQMLQLITPKPKTSYNDSSSTEPSSVSNHSLLSNKSTSSDLVALKNQIESLKQANIPTKKQNIGTSHS